MPFSSRFYPRDEHIFLVGVQNKKIVQVRIMVVPRASAAGGPARRSPLTAPPAAAHARAQFDTRTGDIVQEYDHHLAAVNTVTFVDEGRRFVTTSVRACAACPVTEHWPTIPMPRSHSLPVHVHTRCVLRTTRRSLCGSTTSLCPSSTLASPACTPFPAWRCTPAVRAACRCCSSHRSADPSCRTNAGHYFVGQSMDNSIVTYSVRDNFRQARKKTFKGHITSGFACRIDFSPNGQCVRALDARRSPGAPPLTQPSPR